jgi:hypothetical protein
MSPARPDPDSPSNDSARRSALKKGDIARLNRLIDKLSKAELATKDRERRADQRLSR